MIGKINLRIKEASKEHNNLDLLLVNLCPVSEEVAPRRLGDSSKICQRLQNKESIIRQKSRHKRIREGDLNSKFYHEFMKTRFRRNAILGLNMIGEG